MKFSRQAQDFFYSLQPNRPLIDLIGCQIMIILKACQPLLFRRPFCTAFGLTKNDDPNNNKKLIELCQMIIIIIQFTAC